MVVDEYRAHHFEHELSDVEIRAEVSLLDRHLHRAAQLALESREVIDDRVANGSEPVVELDGGGLHRAGVGQPAPRRPVEPVLEQGTKPRQAAPGFEGGDENDLGKARRRRLDRGDLQFLTRAEVGEEPALREAGTLGQRTDGQRFEAAFAGLLEGRPEDGRARLFTFAHGDTIRTFVLFVKP